MPTDNVILLLSFSSAEYPKQRTMTGSGDNSTIFTATAPLNSCRTLLDLSCADPPPLHLTTSKVMVIVWRLRGNIIRTVFIYCQRATSSMGTVNRNSSYSPVGP